MNSQDANYYANGGIGYDKVFIYSADLVTVYSSDARDDPNHTSIMNSLIAMNEGDFAVFTIKPRSNYLFPTYISVIFPPNHGVRIMGQDFSLKTIVGNRRYNTVSTVIGHNRSYFGDDAATTVESLLCNGKRRDELLHRGHEQIVNYFISNTDNISREYDCDYGGKGVIYTIGEIAKQIRSTEHVRDYATECDLWHDFDERFAPLIRDKCTTKSARNISC